MPGISITASNVVAKPSTAIEDASRNTRAAVKVTSDVEP
jgi:hypothetical protein